MADAWLTIFNPNADDLLDLLFPQIDDGMLRQIAAADYGSGIESHLAPLKELRDHRVIPVLEWHPREVLELIRWSEPEAPDWKPGDNGPRGHLLRAFACSALLVSYERPENLERWDSLNETAIQLVDSLRALNGEMVPTGVSLFAWCIEHLSAFDRDGLERPFLGLALLSLAAKLPTSPDQAIIELCQWIDDHVKLVLPKDQWRATGRYNWLLSTNHHNLRNDRWIGIGRDLYGWAEDQPRNEKTTWVALIGRSLAED